MKFQKNTNMNQVWIQVNLKGVTVESTIGCQLYKDELSVNATWQHTLLPVHLLVLRGLAIFRQQTVAPMLALPMCAQRYPLRSTLRADVFSKPTQLAKEHFNWFCGLRVLLSASWMTMLKKTGDGHSALMYSLKNECKMSHKRWRAWHKWA